MALFERRRRPALPDDVRAAIPLDGGEQVLAWARDETSGGHVVATTHHLALVDAEGVLVWNRPWHEAESGTWQGESSQLTVTWVDRGVPARWRLTEPSLLQQALRERLQASVVLADEFRTAAGRRTVRVVIRQDLASGALLEQTIPGKGADLGDPQVAREAAQRMARLRSEVGL
jgi:hypothetical protein